MFAHWTTSTHKKRGSCSQLSSAGHRNPALPPQATLPLVVHEATKAASFDIRKAAVQALSNVIAVGSHQQVQHLVGIGLLLCLCGNLQSSNLGIATIALEAVAIVLQLGEKIRVEEQLDGNRYADELVEAGDYANLENLLSHHDSDIVMSGKTYTKSECLAEGGNVCAPTFSATTFLAKYNSGELSPSQLHHLMAAVEQVVDAFASQHGALEDKTRFFRALQRNAFTAGGLSEVLDPSGLMSIAVRLWTSTETLDGREFCFMLNEAIRMDKVPAIDGAVVVVHAINTFLVTRRQRDSPAVNWPVANCTFRGGAMPREHRSFFKPGVQYRAPMFVATSSEMGVAEGFLGRLSAASPAQNPPHQEPTLWVFHFDATLPTIRRCVHVNYIDRTDNSVNGEEDEFLFVPYSAFTVRSVTWEERPEFAVYTKRVHRIEVDVCPDNRDAPQDLPLAPWC